ncbi:UPF0764 protein C16orf89 homolog [Athalia rosae]|uniref:UPF0764 protein C16orf89 homolog n=1 Tax=Athalia rosae TaxID=37344 RepID=UPI00203395EF|nr:UPF0764 protein C16orf89 homolog [Athalia rosae]
MKLRTSFYGVATLLAVVILCTKQATSVDTGTAELARRISAFYKAVDFMARRPHQMNVDAVFGLTLSEAHLNRTLIHPNMKLFDLRLSKILSEVLEISQRARQRTKTVVKTSSADTAILNRVLNRPEIWTFPIDWTLGMLGPRPSPNENTPSSILAYFSKGTPNETESDRCMAQLAEDSSEENCQVSDQCADMLIKNDEPKGYPLSHRLLYVQVANALGCSERDFKPFNKLLPAYCTSMLQDAVDLEDANFPLISRDLICEQVILCGMNGYLEFANDRYADLILSWQNSAGCFSSVGFSENDEVRQRRSKRESEGMDFGCDNHATSVGAASLALLIRQYVETSAS